MSFGINGVDYHAKAEGKVSYRPSVASPACGFGRYEVHPQMVERTTAEGSIELAHNGDWLIVCSDWALAMNNPGLGGNAREVAEKQCVCWNKGKPTRVVDLFGHVTNSVHRHDDVVASLRALGVSTESPEDLI